MVLNTVLQVYTARIKIHHQSTYQHARTRLIQIVPLFAMKMRIVSTTTFACRASAQHMVLSPTAAYKRVPIIINVRVDSVMSKTIHVMMRPKV